MSSSAADSSMAGGGAPAADIAEMTWEQLGAHIGDPGARLTQWARNVEVSIQGIKAKTDGHAGVLSALEASVIGQKELVVNLERNTSTLLQGSSAVEAELQKSIIQLDQHVVLKNKAVTDELQRVVSDAESTFATYKSKWESHDVAGASLEAKVSTLQMELNNMAAVVNAPTLQHNISTAVKTELHGLSLDPWTVGKRRELLGTGTATSAQPVSGLGATTSPAPAVQTFQMAAPPGINPVDAQARAPAVYRVNNKDWGDNKKLDLVSHP